MTHLLTCPMELIYGKGEDIPACPFREWAAARVGPRHDEPPYSRVICRTCGTVGPLIDGGYTIETVRDALIAWGLYYQDSDDAPATLE